MSKYWVQSNGARAIDLVDPDLGEIDVADIAHHLSLINRYSGATERPYSVAQHCVLVAHSLALAKCSREIQFAGLVHDAAEAYLGDITSPVKRRLNSLCAGIVDMLEEPVESAIARKLGAIYPWPPEVFDADLRMLVTERRDLLGDIQTRPWGVDVAPHADIQVLPWDATYAEGLWLARFSELAP